MEVGRVGGGCCPAEEDQGGLADEGGGGGKEASDLEREGRGRTRRRRRGGKEAIEREEKVAFLIFFSVAIGGYPMLESFAGLSRFEARTSRRTTPRCNRLAHCFD